MNFSNRRCFEIPEIAIIRPDQKRIPYSIIPIGDKAALLEWRKEQVMLAEAREGRLAPLRAASRQRAVDGVANQNADVTPDAVSLVEKAHADMRDGLVTYKAPERVVMDTYTPPKESWFKRLLKSAFPD